ncbi:MAG: Asd/ArgC dimerization domain-containing protein, partial [Candidatus Poseidoniaceae archaeon]|nr:Asd/ArgC dimerization domain-containing protein [Candidatus Poseidoniaceae archaeon]
MQHHNTVVLGASGLVGQRMQQRLANHPWFRLAAVVGSERTAGKALESIDWNLQEARPNLPNLTVLSADDVHLVERLKEVNITVAFSCLPASIADPLELLLASSGIAVFSNASAFRRCDGVPLVIPDVNPTHLDQFDAAGYTLACATNCTLIPLAVPVAALSQEFGITHVTMNSEQALSGAGYELVLSQTALAGEHPSDIEGEAEKTAAELLHVLGEAVEEQRAGASQQAVQRIHPALGDSKNHVNAASFEVDVNCKRVTRVDGHQIFATVRLKHEATQDEVLACLQKWSLPPFLQTCPS